MLVQVMLPFPSFELGVGNAGLFHAYPVKTDTHYILVNEFAVPPPPIGPS
jgi:hypothetical protein